MSLLSFPNSKSYLFEVLKSLVASDWKHIFIKIIELRIATLGNNSEHIRVIIFLVRYRVLLQADRDIELLYWPWEEGAFAKDNVGLADFHKVFSFLKQLFLRRLVTLIFFRAFLLHWFLLFGVLRYFQILHELANFSNIFCCFLIR